MTQDDGILLRYPLDENEAPSEGVFSAVAAVENCSPLDLTPLASEADPEALDALLTADAVPDHVSFPYCGYEISIVADEILVMELEDE